MEIRHAEPADYGRVIGRVNAWWGGRDMAPMLPQLFFVHFVGVAPERRGEGLGRRLYERFFADARAQQRTRVRCVTSPANEESVAFHEALGFVVERVAHDYDGPGEDRVLFVKTLA